MGYQTPNIDRIAKEGVGFTDEATATSTCPRCTGSTSSWATATI